MGEKRRAYRVWWGNLGERDHFEHIGVDGMMTLKQILKE
jgi:hypothetical protein